MRRARADIKRQADWPRYMTVKRLRGKASAGQVAYYWEPRAKDRADGFALAGEALGPDYAVARDRAILLNAHLDSWRLGEAKPQTIDAGAKTGTVDWWHEHYMRSSAFTKLAVRSQDDYRDALALVADVKTKLTDASGTALRFGALPVGSISPAAVDKVYEKLRKGGRVTRQANRALDVARRAWKVVARMYPGTFLITDPGNQKQRIALNPWVGVERTIGSGTTKPCTREEAFALADALTKQGHPALGLAAVVSFELLQRPENIIAGHLTWGQYRPAERPREIEIFHHKTGERIWHPFDVDDVDEEGRPVVRRLYPELEDRLGALPRLGVPVVMMRPQRGPKGQDGQRQPRIYSVSYADHLVQAARKAAGLASHVTMAACRHGGMTLLGDAELTEQQIMALSGHVTPAAARLYVKRTEAQRRSAAVQRRDYLGASTSVSTGGNGGVADAATAEQSQPTSRNGTA